MRKRGFATANRRYLRWFWPLMAVYAVAMLGGSWLVHGNDTEPLWLGVVAALASALPLMGILLVVLRYFEETDEYTQISQLKAFSRGAVVTVSATFVVGFLQIFDVIDQIEVFWLGPLFFFSWGLSYCLGRANGKTV